LFKKEKTMWTVKAGTFRSFEAIYAVCAPDYDMQDEDVESFPRFAIVKKTPSGKTFLVRSAGKEDAKFSDIDSALTEFLRRAASLEMGIRVLKTLGIYWKEFVCGIPYPSSEPVLPPTGRESPATSPSASPKSKRAKSPSTGKKPPTPKKSSLSGVVDSGPTYASEAVRMGAGES
jgi:hypothetical protein